ncbi:hypothetical protein GCM10009638_21140 [Luteococcus sanguinis]
MDATWLKAARKVVANIAFSDHHGLMSLATLTVNPSTPSAEIIDFNRELARRDHEGPRAGAQLVSADRASVIDLPEELFDVLRFAAENLAAGRAVSIAPVSKMMTTQEAADYLGMSRPSLIKIVDAGSIPHTTVGRHRKIRLGDLIDYQRRAAEERQRALDEMAQVARAEGLHEKTAQSAEGIR